MSIGAFDLLCVVTTPEDIFVIPTSACASPVDARFLNARLQLGPESKYRVFLNQFAVGTGVCVETTAHVIPPLRLPKTRPAGLRGARKAHHYLSQAEVDTIRALPIRWSRAQPGEGLVDVRDVARQYNVCVATLRNIVLNGTRRGLNPQPA